MFTYATEVSVELTNGKKFYALVQEDGVDHIALYTEEGDVVVPTSRIKTLKQAPSSKRTRH